jgi:hypothetical protein
VRVAVARSVVLAQDQPAARADAEVVGRVQRLGAGGLVDERQDATATAGTVVPDLAVALPVAVGVDVAALGVAAARGGEEDARATAAPVRGSCKRGRWPASAPSQSLDSGHGLDRSDARLTRRHPDEALADPATSDGERRSAANDPGRDLRETQSARRRAA